MKHFINWWDNRRIFRLLNNDILGYCDFLLHLNQVLLHFDIFERILFLQIANLSYITMIHSDKELNNFAVIDVKLSHFFMVIEFVNYFVIVGK